MLSREKLKDKSDLETRVGKAEEKKFLTRRSNTVHRYLTQDFTAAFPESS